MNRIRRMAALVVMCVLLSAPAAEAGRLDWLLKDLQNKLTHHKDTTLGDTKIGQGLKKALEVGIDNTVKLTGKTDGFFGNESIKILLPENLRKAEKLLRRVGYDKKIDSFILSMNRAAETAAPFAKDIFLNALMDMTFDDVRGIFEGGDTAATSYFKTKTYNKLVEIFTPLVVKSLDQHEVTGQYRKVFGRFTSLPFLGGSGSDFNIESYVIGKALDGLFTVLGNQEKQIRTDPAARVTDLLREVFK